MAVPVCLLKSMPFPPMAKAQAPLREGAALMLYLLQEERGRRLLGWVGQAGQRAPFHRHLLFGAVLRIC